MSLRAPRVSRWRGAAFAALAPMAVCALFLSPPLPAAAAPAAQAAPTAKDACKGGGWRSWAVLAPFFKNQGACVSYVNHLGDGGVPGTVDPAATPELGSLVLFGSGAAGLAGYAWTRARAGRRGERAAGGDEAPAA